MVGFWTGDLYSTNYFNELNVKHQKPLSKNHSEDMESEKKLIERKTAEIFLDLYNPIKGTLFEIKYIGEAPDVTCIDRKTGKILNLEITLLENIHGDIAHELGRGKKPISPTTGTTAIDFKQDVVPIIRERLESKLLASYGENTALVIRQVSILWERMEWDWITPSIRKLLNGKEDNYGKGIWVICMDHSRRPAYKTIICLSQPVDEVIRK